MSHDNDRKAKCIHIKIKLTCGEFWSWPFNKPENMHNQLRLAYVSFSCIKSIDSHVHFCTCESMCTCVHSNLLRASGHVDERRDLASNFDLTTLSKLLIEMCTYTQSLYLIATQSNIKAQRAGLIKYKWLPNWMTESTQTYEVHCAQMASISFRSILTKKTC